MRIGVDLGGTKIEAIALDDQGVVRHRERIATPRQSAAAIVAAIAQLVSGIERTLSVIASVGVGTPGALSPQTALLRNSNTACLNGVPLRTMLSEALQREVKMANDANCFALSEAVDGAGAGEPVVFGVIIGTGTGGGICVNQQVLVGPNAIAGEWGHNPLPWREAERSFACYCGKLGCIETHLSGPGWAQHHLAEYGQQLRAAQIAEQAVAGDRDARASLASYQRCLAKALAAVINVLDPNVIILGGGVSNVEALYDGIPLQDYVFSDSVVTSVRRARHGDASGVRGAAWL